MTLQEWLNDDKNNEFKPIQSNLKEFVLSVQTLKTGWSGKFSFWCQTYNHKTIKETKLALLKKYK